MAYSPSIMKKLLFGVYLLGSIGAIAAPVEPVTYIKKEVNKLVDLYKDGFGYHTPEMRHVIFGSLFDAERRDAVAFFGITGVDNSNGHYEYIAIFAQGKGRDFSDAKGPKDRPFNLAMTTLVGSRSTRTLDWKTAKISLGTITVQGKRWGVGDAGCCPTKPIEVTFNIPLELGNGAAPEHYPVVIESEEQGQSHRPNHSPTRKPAGKK
jgi:hypothetical protein